MIRCTFHPNASICTVSTRDDRAQSRLAPSLLLNIGWGWCILPASQQVQQVRVPDVAWTMLRLIRASVNAVHFAREHELRLRNRMSQGFWQRLGKHSFPSSLALSLPSWELGLAAVTSGQVEGTFILAAAPADVRTNGYLLDLLPSCYIYEPGQLCLLRFSLISPKNIKKLILPILQCIAASKFLSSALTCSVSLAPPLPLLKY